MPLIESVAILLGDPTVEGGVGGDSEGGLRKRKGDGLPITRDANLRGITLE